MPTPAEAMQLLLAALRKLMNAQPSDVATVEKEKQNAADALAQLGDTSDPATQAAMQDTLDAIGAATPATPGNE